MTSSPALYRLSAQIAGFDPAEHHAYEDNLKYYRDLKNVTDTAREEGIAALFNE